MRVGRLNKKEVIDKIRRLPQVDLQGIYLEKESIESNINLK